jgi:hypothetical protein
LLRFKEIGKEEELPVTQAAVNLYNFLYEDVRLDRSRE